jgi:hypothetical protein
MRQTGGSRKSSLMDTVILIHGAWVTPWCWRYFAPLVADRGYRTLAPAWPLKGRPVGDQLAHPDPRLARVGVPVKET